MDDQKRREFDEYFMQISMAVRAKANCLGSKVGAVIVKDNRIVSTGYNGVPEGMKNCLDGGCLRCINRGEIYPSGTAYDLCICVHAEQNALLTAARFGISQEGSTVYTTTKPCFGCTKEMVQVKNERVVYLNEWKPHDKDSILLKKKLIEYQKILSAIPEVCHLDLEDEPREWAKGLNSTGPDMQGHQ